MERRHANVVNGEEIEVQSGPTKGKYGSTTRRIGQAAGGQKLGCSLYEVAPGKMAFPYHWHGANEEAIIIVAGTGIARIGDQEVPVRAGDYIAMLTGQAHAHQLRNNGTDILRYYCVSTQNDPDIAGYPDSKKLAMFSRAGAKPFRVLLLEEDGQRDYFERDPNV